MVNMGELFQHRRLQAIEMDRVPLVDREASFVLFKGDLLFARQSLVFDGAGRCSIFLGHIEPVTFESHVIRCRLNQVTASPLFYFYFFESPQGKSSITSIVEQGAGQAGICGSDLSKLRVPHPPLSIQTGIASLLDALDQKIELLNSQSSAAENLTRTIFESWFVDFDPVRAKAEGREPEGMDTATAALFPDHLSSSSSGILPFGWHIERIGDVALINRNTVGRDYPHRRIIYIDISSVRQGRIEFQDEIERSNAPSRAKRVVTDGDIIWSCVRPNLRSYAYIAHPAENTVVSTGFAVLSATKVPSAYLYLHVTTDKFVEFLSSRADGAAYPAVRPEIFQSAGIVVPPKAILSAFSDLVSPVLLQIGLNERRARTLAQIRNTLLPRLISGKLCIPDAEKTVGELL